MEILANFIFLSVKVILFAGLAYGGIIMGKKFRDKKSLQNGK